MKRRDFIKGLVAAPVVAKIGVEAIAKPKINHYSGDTDVWVAAKGEGQPYDAGSMAGELTEKSLEDAVVEMVNMKGVFGWSNP